ncbi:MAG: hypothetical protein PQJ46_10455 [Spirochaetales bacterium]|nr:hypothetical protein [Spirochaetales bacterium]
MFFCYSCGHQFDKNFQVYRTTECPSCGRDVRVCLNCEFYSPGANYDCHEHISEAVREKDRANFCDYFKLGNKNPNNGKIEEKADKARTAFNDLFKNE